MVNKIIKQLLSINNESTRSFKNIPISEEISDKQLELIPANMLIRPQDKKNIIQPKNSEKIKSKPNKKLNFDKLKIEKKQKQFIFDILKQDIVQEINALLENVDKSYLRSHFPHTSFNTIKTIESHVNKIDMDILNLDSKIQKKSSFLIRIQTRKHDISPEDYDRTITTKSKEIEELFEVKKNKEQVLRQIYIDPLSCIVLCP